MKRETLFNILTIFVLVATVVVALVLLSIFSNPNSALNPFRPPTLPPTSVLPTATPTQKQLPPTWTPTVPASQPRSFLPDSTPMP